jgi:hypothetical protein
VGCASKLCLPLLQMLEQLTMLVVGNGVYWGGGKLAVSHGAVLQLLLQLLLLLL